MMSKKDYEKAAAIVRRMDRHPEVSTAVTLLLMGELADMFAEDNPRFDRARFAWACVEKERPS